MDPIAKTMKLILEGLKAVAPETKVAVSFMDQDDNPTKVDLVLDGVTLRISVDEIVKIDRSREIIEMTKKIKAGMSPEDIQKFFELRDEHHGKVK